MTGNEISTKFLSYRITLWVLDRQSGNHGELAYIEKDPSSEYRLQTTFDV